MKGCEACPEGYTEVKGGVIYAVTLQDDGADQSTIIESLEGAVAGTAVKGNGQNDAVGVYSVAVEKKLTKEQIDLYGINEKTANTKKAFYTRSSFMLAGNRAKITYNDGTVEYYNICPQNVWRVHSEALLVPVENEEEE